MCVSTLLLSALSALPACAADATEGTLAEGADLTYVDLTPHVDWKMEPRAALAKDAFFITTDGRESYRDSYVHPTSLSLTLTLRGMLLVRGVTAFRWRIRGLMPNAPPAQETAWSATRDQRVSVREQGTYEVTLEGRSADGTIGTLATDPIQVDDIVIAAVGDSMGSGEGNPDVFRKYQWISTDVNDGTPILAGPLVQWGDPGLNVSPFPWNNSGDGHPARYMVRENVWADEVCHRSFNSGFAIAARKYEADHPHTSVTFLSYACSGAVVANLYVDPQKREQGRIGTQLAYLSRDLVVRPAAHLLMSIGINDLPFSGLIKACVAKDWEASLGGLGSCPDEALVTHNLIALNSSYAGLAAQLRGLSFIKNVHLIEYPATALFQNQNHDLEACEELVDWIRPDGYSFSIDSELTLEEMLWLDSVGTRLLAVQERSVHDNGWNYIRGMDAAFQNRGYCAPEPQRYFNRHNESGAKQDNEDGSFHPNNFGYEAMANIVNDALTAADAPVVYVPVGTLPRLRTTP